MTKKKEWTKPRCCDYEDRWRTCLCSSLKYKSATGWRKCNSCMWYNASKEKVFIKFKQ